MGKLNEAINAYPNPDFRKFLELGLNEDYKKRLNEDEIIELLQNMKEKKPSLDENKKDVN